jgi:hypothetical protein
MGVDYKWEKFFSSIHYAVTSTELLQQRLQVVVSGIDGLRRDSFHRDETYERFEKLMTATKMLPARGNEGRLAATTSQMEESEAKQWLQEAPGLFSDDGHHSCLHATLFRRNSRVEGRLRPGADFGIAYIWKRPG